MNNELKEILSNANIHIIECDKNWCNAYGYEKSQLKEDLLECITNLQKRKITKEDVEKYFEENMCVSFEKFLENWKEQEELTKYLQKENERLNTELNAYKDEFCKDTIKEYELVMEQEDYKSRCEKAIEYIKSPKICIDIRKTDGTLDFVSTDELLNILNGGDE